MSTPSKSPKTGITGKARETLSKILDHVLRDECSLSAIIRDYRWNVTGPNLYSLHRLFDEQRRQLEYWLDQVVDRAHSVGFGGRGSVKPNVGTESGAASAAGVPVRSMVGDLLTRHEEMAHRLRDDIERLRDPATADLLLRLAEFHETTAWMLRVVSHGANAEDAG